MRTYNYEVAGDPVKVHVPEVREDIAAFRRWFVGANRRGPIAFDTETTGLDIYSPGYRLRTAQFGDRNTAWVLHYERGGYFSEAAEWALILARWLQIHNAPFDWAVSDRHTLSPDISIESLAPRTIDTRLKAGLVDPRQPQEGGRGTALKPLAAYYVDPAAPDTQGDLTAEFRKLGLTKATGWAGIPLDHPTYNLYAGLDCILTARLDPHLDRELSALDVRPRLIQYEHELARIGATMQRTGLVLDVPYTESLSARLGEEEERFAAIAAQHGVTNVNAPAQLREAFVEMGEDLTERTASGLIKVDKVVLHTLADLDARSGKRMGKRASNPLAEAVIRSKRAGKWNSAYARTFLDTVDAEGRVHAFVNTMLARTARMSITRPALQTLPSSDAVIRRCLLAEEGHRILSCDFQAVEMRVLAALADVRRMREGFTSGGDDFDIHMYTAQLIKGDAATATDRKVFKGAGFGKVYGGGVTTIARQTGASEDEISRAVAAYDRAFPEIRRMSRRWQREARETGMVHISVTGRRLPLDAERAYAVVNYAVQSAARDVLGQSLLNLEAAGLLPYMRLPIHDEVLCSVPAGEAKDFAKQVEECMSFDLFGVPITSDAEVGGRSWGSLYMTRKEDGNDVPDVARLVREDPFFAEHPSMAQQWYEDVTTT